MAMGVNFRFIGCNLDLIESAGCLLNHVVFPRML
jgi:hypothetical protein